MPENPLLPDAELRALLALTKRVIALDAAAAPKPPSPRTAAEPRKRSTRSAPEIPHEAARGATRGVASTRLLAREAALAATTIQLRAGDLLVPGAGDSALLSLSPKAASGASQTSSQLLDPLPAKFTKGTSRLLFATALASGLRSLGTEGVALAFTRPGRAEPGWLQALAWAQAELLPLILVCLDPSGPAAFTSRRSPATGQFDWSGVAPATARLKLPVLTLDGEDAVAMYRATQEAILRARAGGGPAVLWASLSPPAAAGARPPAKRPLLRLTQYMRARKIALS